MISEATIARSAPRVLWRSLKVLLKLNLRSKALQAGETDVRMAHSVVVFEMVLEVPFILEGAETQVAVHFVTK